MDYSNSEPPGSVKEQHERRSKLVGGYIAFTAALLVATIAKSNDYPRAWIVISLFALSLPSLVAWSLLDFIILVKQGRRKSMFRGLAGMLGFFPSLAAVAILIGHFSVIAGVLFVLLTIFWGLAIDIVTFLGAESPKSEV
jgi:hypothetical protein